ncbi:MAG TPA: formate dehydrogenase accessory sulfurtransferase FdhD [Dehalococcoidia bacterium]|nr:formate dehydrogenase accessory sulfurtransferase FdhD [Dehalococcoidia bacterium]
MEGTERRPVLSVGGRQISLRRDLLAVEEPLEVRVVTTQEGRRRTFPLAVVMRTPGHDFELAVGLLYCEGVVGGPGDIVSIANGDDSEPHPDNVVEVHLAEGVPFDPVALSRHVYTTSACGVCGRASLDHLRALCPRGPSGHMALAPSLLQGLPARLRQAQGLFATTGGVHAAALFDERGHLLMLREDVGRHNAMDKLVGALLLSGRLPASDTIVLVSGRASFELAQKAAMAGIPVLAALGAPSSLAVRVAEAYGMTLVGFLGPERFNVYAGAQRLSP